MDKLFSPISVGPFELDHRVVLAPLTRMRTGHVRTTRLIQSRRRNGVSGASVARAPEMIGRASGASSAQSGRLNARCPKWPNVCSWSGAAPCVLHRAAHIELRRESARDSQGTVEHLRSGRPSTQWTSSNV
nr:hypothetical protein [Paraburkholderia sp. Ac-20347]